jgi:hypothetical protein
MNGDAPNVVLQKNFLLQKKFLNSFELKISSKKPLAIKTPTSKS